MFRTTVYVPSSELATPSPASECALSPGTKGEGHTRLGVRGWVPIPTTSFLSTEFSVVRYRTKLYLSTFGMYKNVQIAVLKHCSFHSLSKTKKTLDLRR